MNATSPHVSPDGSWPRGSDTGLFELRRYRAAAGRLQEEIDRALSCILPPEERGLGLFTRHGIPAPTGFWRAVSGSSLPCVVFLYRWPSAASRAEAFEAFYKDADWNRERARTNGGSEIVDRLDDLLLVGSVSEDLAAAPMHEFRFGEAAGEGSRVLASFLPLCGERAERLCIIGHSSIEAAIASARQADGAPLLCTPVGMRRQ